MLERDLIKRNVQTLVQMLARLKRLSLDKPEDALYELQLNMDESILDKLERKSGQILLLDDQLVKVQMDMALLQAEIQYNNSNDRSTGIEGLKRVKQLMLNYQEIFPKNFPFDYYGKMSKINQLIENN